MQYKLSSGLSFDKVGKELIITKLDGEMLVLNELAAKAVELIDSCDGATVEMIANHFRLTLNLTNSDAERCSKEAISLLRSNKIITERLAKKPEMPIRTRALTRRSLLTVLASMCATAASPARFSHAAEISDSAKSISCQFNSTETNGTITIYNSEGEELTVHLPVRSAVPYGPYAQALLESIDPGIVVQASLRGIQASMSHQLWQNAEILLEEHSAEDISQEAVRKFSPDLILDLAYNSNRLNHDINSSIPTLHLAARFGDLEKLYELLGKLFCRQERTMDIIRYVNEITGVIESGRQRVLASETKRVYLGEGELGLNSRGPKTLISAVLEKVGAVNVLSDYIDNRGYITIQDIEKLKPDVLIIGLRDNIPATNSGQYIKLQQAWEANASRLGAQIHFVPSNACSLIGSSPLLLQTLGALWFGNTLYPEAFPYSFKEVAQEFFGIMYANPSLYDYIRG